MALVGWLQRGALVFFTLPDCWAASLVCLFKLAQQGPVVARVIFFIYFWSNFNIRSVRISFSLTPRTPFPNKRSIRISSRQSQAHRKVTGSRIREHCRSALCEVVANNHRSQIGNADVLLPHVNTGPKAQARSVKARRVLSVCLCKLRSVS